MQLKSLEIYGFKSFGEKTTLLFEQGITGIVGPNGCGKSNVVDAIRWVLGEQKTKKLRSEKMEEVIFNGTQKKKKASFCEVSMTFENTRNILPTEYTTVTITRKLFRDGESEYLLNNIPCRLKDITNLFMDTGIGPDSYAIIELGMVKDILNDKDHSRKQLFEEAAGVAKYKVRKLATFRKLEETQGHLSRVEDLLFEIDGNLKTLEKQAKKAERYLDLRSNYRHQSSQLAYLKIRHLNDAYESIEAQEQKFQEEIMGIQASIDLQDAKILEIQKEIVDQEIKLSISQKELNQHTEFIQKVESEKSIRNERLKYLQQREYSIGQQLQQEKTQLESSEKFQIHSRTELEAQKAILQSAENEFIEQKAIFEKAQADRLLKQKIQDEMLEALKVQEGNLSQLIREKEIRQIRIESLTTEVSRNEQEKASRIQELDAFSEKLISLQSLTEQLAFDTEALLNKKQETESQQQQLSDKSIQLKDEIYRLNGILNAKQNEFDLTKSLVENLEGFPESIKFLKKEFTWTKEAPLLSDIFGCEEIYKVAFENFLDPYMNYYIVETRLEALAGIRLLSNAAKGRANFFIMQEIRQHTLAAPISVDNCIPAIQLVEVQEAYLPLAKFLLNKVYMANQERDIPEQVNPGTVFLTKEGNITERKFILSGGSTGLFEGKRLGRAQNLEKLEKEIRTLDQKLQELRDELNKVLIQIQNLKDLNITKSYEDKNKIYQASLQDYNILKTKEEEYRNFLQTTGLRTEDLWTEINRVKEEIETFHPQITELQTAVELQQQSVLSFKDQVSEANQWEATQSGLHNQLNLNCIELKNKVVNLEKDIQRSVEADVRIHQQIQTLKAELEETKTEILKLVNTNMTNDDEIIGLYKIKTEKEAQTLALENELTQFKSSVLQVENKIRQERKNKEEIDIQRQQVKDQIAQIKLELHTLKDRMEVEFGIQLADLSEAILADLEEPSVESLLIQVSKTKEKIQNFGEVNPMAVEAYQELKERYDFITVQKNDLTEARESLLSTIAEIDTDARNTFMDAFTRIRENFIKVFQTLFNEGDICDLILINSEDPLDSDIDIIAKPKGKRPLNINQLSGGEQTLTAISLLFAIYLLKPAPFCVFDEVDAPLDDANIDKFNTIIREFAGNSQFIIVTHNKRTMVSTHVIYGVTMQETGVSKVLPVSLEALQLN